MFLILSFFLIAVTLCRTYRLAPSGKRNKMLLWSNDIKKVNLGNSKDKQLKKANTDKSNISVDNLDFVKLATEERLQKVIARAGIASRREAEKLILDGRVVVNGNIITELGVKIKPGTDIITVDGKKIQLPDSKSIFWVAVNKPRDILTTMEDEKSRETIVNIVPRAKELRLLPIGRLGRESTGIVLMTNENGWIHPLTHPSYHHRMRYEIVVKGFPNENELQKLRDGGVILPDNDKYIYEDNEPLLPIKPINIIDMDRGNMLSLIDIIIEESRPDLLQRIFSCYLKCDIVSIKRTEFGPIGLKGLRKGTWRELTKSEIENIKRSCKEVKQQNFRFKKNLSKLDKNKNNDYKRKPAYINDVN